LGNVYVAYSAGNQIQVFDSSGTLLNQWGSSSPNYGIAVDSDSNVYVPVFNDNRVNKFDSGGNFTGEVRTFNPFDAAVDANGYLYLSQPWRDRIQKYTLSGGYTTQWGEAGSGNGQFDEPRGVAVDAQGNVYVCDSMNDRIQKFDSSGAFITTWGSTGGAVGLFRFPNGVAVDNNGNVYVADTLNHRIQKFTPPAIVVSASTGIIVDNTPPSLDVSVDPAVLWPPNNKMIAVTAAVMASDNYDPSPSIALDSIVFVGSKALNGNSENGPDIQSAEIGAEDCLFMLRASTNGNGKDCLYIVTYVATDTAGNSVTTSATVTVPHDQGKKISKGLRNRR
jgi:hypothetical protein